MLEYAVQTYLQKKKQGEDKLTTHDWKEIANFIPGRTESQCLYKWNLTKRKVSFRKSTWQPTEDAILRELVAIHGKKHWQKIANELNERIGGTSNRAGKQCRERWLNHLDNVITKNPWSCQEDLTLLTKQKIIGNKWSEIVKYLPGRTENMVKNRFNTLAKQKREERRNNQVKKLDEVIVGLEESKDESADKDSWIDEKIKELIVDINKEGPIKVDQKIDHNPHDKMSRPSIEERKTMKYQEKKGFYGNERDQYDKNKDYVLDNNMSSKILNQNRDNLQGMKETSVNVIVKPMNYEVNEKVNIMYDSTPKQHFDQRDLENRQMSAFTSPFDQRRMIPYNNQGSQPMRMNDYCGVPNKQIIIPSPIATPDVKNWQMRSPNINQVLNSPNSLKLKGSLNKLINTKSLDNHIFLSELKQYLNEFKEYSAFQKDKAIQFVNNMIIQNTAPQTTIPLTIEQVSLEDWFYNIISIIS